jgi:membrane-associated protease RseP (regulator of RpoE activity)
MGLWVNARNNGLVISDIAQNSAFSTAGFRAGDQLVSVNNQPITTEQQFVQYLNGPSLGTQPVQFVVLRNGQQQTLTLQPTALSQGIVNHDPLYQYGLVLNNQNPNQIVVQQVYPRTPAYYAGIRQGDVITTLGGQRIANVNAFTQGLAQANAAIPLQISRAGQMQSIQLDPIQANGQAFANDQINAGGPAAHTALRPNLDGANINPGVNAGVNANANVGANVPGVNANLNAGPAGVNANLNAAPAGANVNASTTAPAAGAAAAAGANDAIGAAPRSEPNSPVAAPPAANDRSSNSNDRPAPPANDRNADRGDNNGKRGGDRDAREPRPSGTVPATPATPASGSKSDRDGKSDAHPATPAQPGNGANSPSGSNSANSPR